MLLFLTEYDIDLERKMYFLLCIYDVLFMGNAWTLLPVYGMIRIVIQQFLYLGQ